jgi:hypothetical protein
MVLAGGGGGSGGGGGEEDGGDPDGGDGGAAAAAGFDLARWAQLGRELEDVTGVTDGPARAAGALPIHSEYRPGGYGATAGGAAMAGAVAGAQVLVAAATTGMRVGLDRNADAGAAVDTAAAAESVDGATTGSAKAGPGSSIACPVASEVPATLHRDLGRLDIVHSAPSPTSPAAYCTLAEPAHKKARGANISTSDSSSDSGPYPAAYISTKEAVAAKPADEADANIQTPAAVAAAAPSVWFQLSRHTGRVHLLAGDGRWPRTRRRQSRPSATTDRTPL